MVVRFGLVALLGTAITLSASHPARAENPEELTREITRLREENAQLRERDKLLRDQLKLKNRVAISERRGSHDGELKESSRNPREAYAADLPYKAVSPPPAPARVFRWTGCHLGGNVGGGWSKNSWSQFGFLPDTEVRSSGWLAGGQLGCDYQVNRLVAGVEGAYDWSDLKGSHLVSGSLQDSRRSTIDGIATLTGRVGLAFDGLLPYLKGGAAWVHSKHQSDFVGFGTFTSAYNSAQGAAAGWLLGAGIEGTLFSNWSWNVEYNYISLGTNSFALTCNVGAFCFPLGGVGIAIQQPIAQEIQLVKVGVNYRFGWPL